MYQKYFTKVLEVVSKPQIRFKGKAQADRESAAYILYVSIYRRPATQPLGLRWGFDTTSDQYGLKCQPPGSKVQRSAFKGLTIWPINESTKLKSQQPVTAT